MEAEYKEYFARLNVYKEPLDPAYSTRWTTLAQQWDILTAAQAAARDLGDGEKREVLMATIRKVMSVDNLPAPLNNLVNSC